jgi:hypothetical protein
VYNLIPEKLDDWTYEIIAELVKRNCNESDRHDFKSDLPDAPTLTKICCAFANTKGGFVILGIKEVGSSFMIEGIDNDRELAHKFGQKITANPTIDFDLPKIIPIPDQGKVLAVFHIPLSPERPHVSMYQGFWKRTNKGNDAMTYEEIRMSFHNYEERVEKLKLLYIELLSNFEQLKKMKVEDPSGTTYSLVTLDSTVINNLLTDLFTIIGRNKRLVRILFTIREETKIMNNKIRMFYSTMTMPLTNKNELVKAHNQFVNQKASELVPLIIEATNILETDFKLKNPLKD